MRKLFYLFLLSILTATTVVAQEALPNDAAEGHAKSTRHCYADSTNPTIYKITSLNNSGTGTLRECVEATGNRACIFEKSGLITLSSNLKFTNDNICIFGETAPTPGIYTYGESWRLDEVNDVYIGHVGILGDENNTNEDGITIIGSSNIYLRHVGIAWATDELIDVSASGTGPTVNTRSSNITFDRVFAFESLMAGGGFGDGKNVLIGRVDNDYATNVTFYKSLFVHTNSRNFKVRPGSEVEVINTFFVHVGDGRTDNMNLSADGASETDNTKLDMVEGATIIALGAGQESDASDYVVGSNGTNLPGSSTEIHVDNYLHLDDWTSPAAGRRQSTGAGDNWDVVETTLPSGTYQSLTRVASSSITEDTVDAAYNDVVSSDDATFDGNVGPQPGTRIADTVQPFSRVGLEAININTDSNAIMKDCVESSSCANDAGGLPNYTNNTRTITVVADPHGASSKYAGYTNFEEQIHDDYRADVEPQTAPGADAGEPAATANIFNVERGEVTFGASARTSSNVDLTQSLGADAGYCVVTNTIMASGNPSATTSTDQSSRDMGITITYVDNDTIQFAKDSGADLEDTKVEYECRTYTGAASGDYEWKVRYRDNVTIADSTTTIHQAVASISDMDNFIAIVAGCTTDNGGSQVHDRTLATAGTNTSPSNGIDLTRGDGSAADTATCSVVGLELTGSGWTVRNDIALDCGDGANTANSFTAVTDITNCFIHHSFRNDRNNQASQAAAIWFKDVDEIYCRMDAATTDAVDMDGVAHVICADDATLGMDVQHLDSITGGETDHANTGTTKSTTVTAVSDLTNSMVRCSGTNDVNDTTYPKGWYNYELSDTTTISWFTPRTGATVEWACQVAQLPTGSTSSAVAGSMIRKKRGDKRKQGIASW